MITAAAKRWRFKNKNKLKAYSRKVYESIRLEAISRYGTQCASCGFRDLRVLQIDHIENDGARERKFLGTRHAAGYPFYRWLKKMGWPKGYQTLCANCNIIKYRRSLGASPTG